MIPDIVSHISAPLHFFPYIFIVSSPLSDFSLTVKQFWKLIFKTLQKSSIFLHQSSQVFLMQFPFSWSFCFSWMSVFKVRRGEETYVSYFPLPDTATWPDSAIWESGASSDQSVDTHDFREAASANQILSRRKESYSNSILLY